MKYASKKELYSNEVSKILVETGMICADDFRSFKNYILGATI